MSACVCVSVCMAVLFQVPPAPLPASMWKKSQIPLLLSPGGLVLIITVQLLPTPSRLEPLSPWVGKLLAQVGLLTSLHWSKHLLQFLFSLSFCFFLLYYLLTFHVGNFVFVLFCFYLFTPCKIGIGKWLVLRTNAWHNIIRCLFCTI